MKKQEAGPRKAVAVKYDGKLPAPFIVAKGKDALAERLVQIAREHGVVIAKENKLSEMLFDIDVGTFIPEELYEIIAQLLSYVYDVRKKA